MLDVLYCLNMMELVKWLNRLKIKKENIIFIHYNNNNNRYECLYEKTGE